MILIVLMVQRSQLLKKMNKTEISIVTCSYNSKKYIRSFIRKINLILTKLRIKNFEIIIVDDFSDNETQRELKKVTKIHRNLKVIFLNKNLQLHKAMMIGIKNAKGKYIYCTDIDLEVSEKYLLDFYYSIKKKKVDIVCGVYKNSNTKSFLEYTFKTFFLFYSKLLLKKNTLVYKSSTLIMTKKYSELLFKIKSNNFTLSTLIEGIGNQASIDIIRQNTRISSYNIVKRFTEGYEIVSKLSNSFSVYIIALTLLSIIITIFYLGKNLYVRLTGEFLSGFTDIITIVSLMSSLILIILTFNTVLIIKIKNELENKFNLEDAIKEKINFKN